MKTDSITYTLLKTYAATRLTLTPAGTIDQFTSWYMRDYGIRVPERTFKRHIRVLRDAGLISVKHTRNRTFYTLLDFEYDMPKVKFLPASTPGQFIIADDGTELVSYKRLMTDQTRDVKFTEALPY